MASSCSIKAPKTLNKDVNRGIDKIIIEKYNKHPEIWNKSLKYQFKDFEEHKNKIFLDLDEEINEYLRNSSKQLKPRGYSIKRLKTIRTAVVEAKNKLIKQEKLTETDTFYVDNLQALLDYLSSNGDDADTEVENSQYAHTPMEHDSIPLDKNHEPQVAFKKQINLLFHSKNKVNNSSVDNNNHKQYQSPEIGSFSSQSNPQHTFNSQLNKMFQSKQKNNLLTDEFMTQRIIRRNEDSGFRLSEADARLVEKDPLLLEVPAIRNIDDISSNINSLMMNKHRIDFLCDMIRKLPPQKQIKCIMAIHNLKQSLN